MSNQQVDLSNAKPFVFELSFDAEDMAERRRQKIAARESAAADDAAANTVEAVPTFSEDDLAAAKAQAFEEGRAAGLADAASQRESGLAGILESISAQVAGLHVHQDVANEKLAADLTEFGHTVLSRILPHLIAKHGCEEVTAILTDGFSRLVHEDRISITVGQDAHDMLEPRIEAIAAKSGYDGRLKLVADPDMGAADIVVNWGDGRLEHSTDEIWNEIDAKLESAIAGMRDYADQLEQTAPGAATAPKPEPKADTLSDDAAPAEASPEASAQTEPAIDAAGEEATAIQNDGEQGEPTDVPIDPSVTTDGASPEAAVPVESPETIEQG